LRLRNYIAWIKRFEKQLKKAIPFSMNFDSRNVPFFLAPVAGYSDVAFRAICFEMGAALCYTEMISAEALVRGHPKTKLLLARDSSERYFAIQLFGSNPTTLAKAARIAADYKPVVIDLNCGCPVPKIIKAGAGAALLRTPERIGEIVRAMRDQTSVPISIKMRTGWDQDSINYLEVAAIAVQAGVCAITLHGRTRAQGYSGKADWEAIKVLSEQTSVPVFGSGDVLNAGAAISMIRETRCDGVMVARGAIGNPFIFSDLNELDNPKEAEAYFYKPPSLFIENSSCPERTLLGLRNPGIIAKTALHHLEMSARYLGERTACIEFRKHFCAYTRGLPGGSELRAKAVRCSTIDEYKPLIEIIAKAPT